MSVASPVWNNDNSVLLRAVSSAAAVVFSDVLHVFGGISNLPAFGNQFVQLYSDVGMFRGSGMT
jgi:hypothetical protein